MLDDVMTNRRQFLSLVAALVTTGMPIARAQVIVDNITHVTSHHIVKVKLRTGEARSFNLDVDEVKIVVDYESFVIDYRERHYETSLCRAVTYMVEARGRSYLSNLLESSFEEDERGHFYYTITLLDAVEQKDEVVTTAAGDLFSFDH